MYLSYRMIKHGHSYHIQETVSRTRYNDFVEICVLETFTNGKLYYISEDLCFSNSITQGFGKLNMG